MPPYLSSRIADSARYGTIEDVERTRRVSRASLYKLIGASKVIARKLGTRTLIDLESLDAYLASLPDAKVASSRPPGRKLGESGQAA
jgi:hypothetical protein